jgi:hypothetical protein
MSLETFDQIISDYEMDTGNPEQWSRRQLYDSSRRIIDGDTDSIFVNFNVNNNLRNEFLKLRKELQDTKSELQDTKSELEKCYYSPDPGEGYLEAKDSFERLNLENQSGGKRRLKYYYNGGMKNLKPYSKKELEKLDRYMPGSWNFVQMEEDRIDDMPLNRSHPKFVCEDIYDKIGYLEGWMRKVINQFQPNNPNIHIEMTNFFPNVPQKIFNYETLAGAIRGILGNTTPSVAAKGNIKLFLKHIVTGIVKLGSGIFINLNDNQIDVGEPLDVFEEIIVGPTEDLISYEHDDIFAFWDVEIQGHELEGYNVKFHKLLVSGEPGAEFFAINGMNIHRIEEDLPEILEGINVLKKQVSRTCNVRSSRINRAGGKSRKLLRWVKK